MNRRNTLIKTRPSASTLMELLAYSPRRGLLTWRVDRGRTAKAGDEAGAVRNTDGQVVVTVHGRQYLAQRLIWLYMLGEEPPGPLTFLDRNPTNLKWSNIDLRTNHLSQNKSAKYQRKRRDAARLQQRFEAQRRLDIAAGLTGKFDRANEGDR